MKTLFIFFLLISSLGYSQTTTLYSLPVQYLNNSSTMCDSITIDIAPNGFAANSTASMNFRINGVNLLNKNYTASITWGDNSTTTHTGTSTTANSAIIWTPVISNTISFVGLDTLQILLVENSSSDSIVRDMVYNSNICEKTYFNSNIDCNGDGILDDSSVYILPYVYNLTDTIHSIYGGTDSTYYFPDTLTGTYSTGFDYGWNIVPLLSVSPSTITFPTNGTPPIIDLVFTCQYQSCVKGTVFCDDNNNGVYDTLTENPIINMPLESATTDSNGVYNLHLGNQWNPYTSTYINLPTNWISSNNYYSAAYGYSIDSTFLDSACNGSSFDIPITCTPLTNSDSICFSGTIFLDANHNGIFDTGETVYPSTSVLINIDGFGYTSGTNSSGSYSFSGVHPGGPDSVQVDMWGPWLTNNGLVFSGPFLVTDYNCDSNHIVNIPLTDASFNSVTNLFMMPASNNNFVCDTLSVSLSPIGYDTISNTDLLAYFSGVNLLNEQYSLVINWGDNTSTTHTGTATAANQSINWTPALTHIYGTSNYYNVNLSVTKISLQHTNQHGYSINYSTQCPDYAISISNIVDCDGDGNQDGSISNVSNWPGFAYYYYFHHSSFYLYNATDTIFADSCDAYGQLVYWPNSMPAGNYSLGILQSAQDSIDLTWLSSNPTNSFTIPSGGNLQSITNTFNCIQNQACINGYVFCDDNGNGIKDGNEAIIPNAPLNLYGYIHFNGSVNSNDSTDNFGYYNFPFTIYDTANFSMYLDQSWLAANGYIAQTNNYNFDFPSYNGSDSIFDCSTNFNIPLICNAAATDSICVSGQIFCDVNNNGMLDPNESAIPNALVQIDANNSANWGITFTDSLGNYTYHNYHPNTDTAEVYIPSYWLANNGYAAMSPITVTTLDCSISTDIAIDCNIPLPCDNTWINLFGAGPYYQNWMNTIALTFGNSNYTFPGSVYTISIIIPSGSSLDTSSFSVSNYTLSGDTLSWSQTISNFDSLLIGFNVDAGIPDSTFHTYQAIISGPNLDCDSTNNMLNYTTYIGASYDPNNKLVNLPEFINPAIQEELYYTINFQNTGTAPAQDVFIEDQLSQYLDWNSLEIISKSHNMFYSLDANGKIVFTFPQIWLPDSTTNEPLSKGYVAFKIKESATIPVNQPIENTAHIFFDLNPAIITNTTKNTNIIGLGLNNYNQANQIAVFPNPSSGLISLRSFARINAISIYDLSGKLVYSSLESDSFVALDLTVLSKGMYQIKIETENGRNFEKLILK
ncbi:MAG: T9SS type A sorting domain-containing protein [Crocinitomicaceae bacterium]